MPTSAVLEVLEAVTCDHNMINLSFESGKFAQRLEGVFTKTAAKKCGLDIAFNNFRPVSNLRSVSKLSEKAVANQYIDHMTTSDLHMPLQSAYKQNYITKSALLKVKNDILLKMDAQKATLLVLLDLSADFDIVRHDTLLNRRDSVWMARHQNGLRRTQRIVHSVSLLMMAYHRIFHSDKAFLKGA